MWERRSKKNTVEDCLSIDAGDLVRWALIQAGARVWGHLYWNCPRTGELQSSIVCESDTLNPDEAWRRLSYTVKQHGKPVGFTVLLTATRPNFGGVRWWFVCPVSQRGRACDRRVGKLYLPPGGKYFGCRHCYDLTYTSCRRSYYGSFYSLV
jgi:hypothetical protein